MKNYVEFKNGHVCVKNVTDDQAATFDYGAIMPDILDVEEIGNDGSVKVVRVTFFDCTSEKAVLSANDHYSLEDGISICIAKKLLSDRTGGHGTAVYNKVIDHAVKVMNENKAADKKFYEEQAAKKEKAKKVAAKKAAKRAKRENEEREAALNFYAEAYARAMRIYNEGLTANTDTEN